jgi:hypothetical protein
MDNSRLVCLISRTRRVMGLWSQILCCPSMGRRQTRHVPRFCESKAIAILPLGLGLRLRDFLLSVAPFILLFPEDILAQSNAVYGGVQHDDLYGPVDTWTFHVSSSRENCWPLREFMTIQMRDSLQVTFFLDSNNTLVRYDFTSSDPLRTFATTRFFNIITGPVDARVFETSCP